MIEQKDFEPMGTIFPRYQMTAKTGRILKGNLESEE
jgi:hypothetical protein